MNKNALVLLALIFIGSWLMSRGALEKFSVIGTSLQGTTLKGVAPQPTKVSIPGYLFLTNVYLAQQYGLDPKRDPKIKAMNEPLTSDGMFPVFYEGELQQANINFANKLKLPLRKLSWT